MILNRSLAVLIILNCSVAEIYSDDDAIITIMIIMTIRCGSKILMRAVELKQVINKQWPKL